MQFGLIGSQRATPLRGLKASCPICGDPLVAKCGSKIAHHWAHQGRLHCDPWWENETQWHRDWKENFPEHWREVALFDVTGEKHQADVRTPTGLVVEFQNSPMDRLELAAREAFYRNLIWIVNAAKFQKQFEIGDALPDPDAEFFKDIVFYPNGFAFYRRSENLDAAGNLQSMVRIYGAREIAAEINKNYIGHHAFVWKKPRSVWFEAKCPVYLDFGRKFLWRIERHCSAFYCVRAVKRDRLINDIVIRERATQVATSSDPLL